MHFFTVYSFNISKKRVRLNQKSGGNTLTYYPSTITEGRFHFRSEKTLKIFIFKGNLKVTFEDNNFWNLFKVPENADTCEGSCLGDEDDTDSCESEYD